jgi:tRNA threonylcarbamoyladenosine modification (KEOPS) complex  Pcc1 subunit
MSKININNSIEEVRALLSKEKNISSALRASIEVILRLITFSTMAMTVGAIKAMSVMFGVLGEDSDF